jgi:hypothetical protein
MRKREAALSITPPQLGKTQALGEILSPTLFSHLTSHDPSQIMLNQNLGNPRFSKLKMLSADPLINNLSLLLLPHTKSPTTPPLPAKLEVLPILGGSALEFDSKKDKKHYFCEVWNICVEGGVERTRWSHIAITFSMEDVRLQGFPHNDALVIKTNISSWTLGKLLVDNGSSADIIFVDAYEKMDLSKNLLQPLDTPLYGFGGRVIHEIGKVSLPVSFGTIQNARTEYLSFDVVEICYPYNRILGRGFLNKLEAIIHQAYLCVKIPATQGVITIWGHQNDG